MTLARSERLLRHAGGNLVLMLPCVLKAPEGILSNMKFHETLKFQVNIVGFLSEEPLDFNQ